MHIKKLPEALVIIALVTLTITLGVATPNVYGDGDDSPPTLPEKTELKYPNLGSNLDQLVASINKGKTSAKEAAEDAPARPEASVPVTIYLSGNLDEVVKFLEENGGLPRNVDEDYIEAHVPVSMLGQVSEQPGVIRVRKIVPPATTQLVPPQLPKIAQQVTGHGPPVHGSSAWNQAGLRGRGIKVGIIGLPFGFNGFSRLMGTELPSTVQARCYTSLGKFTRFLASCENAILGSNHGTLVAEAVIDIAPEVSLYIATPRSPGDLKTTTDWMVSQGVSVIVHSITHEYDGPGDGTSPFSNSPLKTIDRAVAGGSVWVNSTGNYGQSTWFGPPVNSDGDTWIDFNGSDESIDMQLEAGDEIRVQLRWEDSWGKAASDFDLLIYTYPTQVIAASSFDPQQGRPGQVPLESLSYIAPRDGWYSISVAHHSGSMPEWIQITAWGIDYIEPHTEHSGIANPAESSNPGMLAVGAANWNSVDSIEPYSSRGPTPDGRVKPDIVGADCGATALRPLDEYGDGFCGTSQAAPHVAGMAALVRQQFPTYTPVQVANYLKGHAEQRESPDPNNTWGHGFAKLPTVDRTALLALYNATDGANWTNNTNWLTSGALSTWYGVTTNSQGRISELNLTHNQLKGKLPPELANLTNLEVLTLGGNQLTGTVPTWLSNLVNLQELYLWGNKLTGEIPTELSSLSNLTELYLHENQLTGEISAKLGNLTNLTILSLSENQLTGEIPRELGNLTSLTGLSLSENQLTGPIPPEFSNLTKLERLSLSQNMLTGCVPEAWQDITESDVLELSLPFCTVDLNTAPIFSDSESNPITEAGRSVVENTAAGENVGAPVAATDNNRDTLTYALDGTDAASFDIDPLTGQLMTQEALDYETKDSYEVTVTATDPDSTSAMITVTVTVTNLDEAGTVTLSSEKPTVGYNLTATPGDPDGDLTDVTWQWSKSANMKSWMDISGATSMSYTPTPMDVGYHLRATATYTDPLGSGKTARAVSDSMTTVDPLIVRYDANGNGLIEKNEVIKAITDYIFGEGNPVISKSDVIKLITLYIFG